MVLLVQTISPMPTVVLRQVWMMLIVLLLVGVLVLVIVHHRHSPTSRAIVNSPMLVWLVALTEHAV